MGTPSDEEDEAEVWKNMVVTPLVVPKEEYEWLLNMLDEEDDSEQR